MLLLPESRVGQGLPICCVHRGWGQGEDEVETDLEKEIRKGKMAIYG